MYFVRSQTFNVSYVLKVYSLKFMIQLTGLHLRLLSHVVIEGFVGTEIKFHNAGITNLLDLEEDLNVNYGCVVNQVHQNLIKLFLPRRPFD